MKLTDRELSYKGIVDKFKAESENQKSQFYTKEGRSPELRKTIARLEKMIPRETSELLNDIKFDKNGVARFFKGSNIKLKFHHSDDLFREVERHQDELRAMGYAVEIENFSNYHANGTNIIVRDKAVFTQKQKHNEIIVSALFIGFLVLLALILYFFL